MLDALLGKCVCGGGGGGELTSKCLPVPCFHSLNLSLSFTLLVLGFSFRPDNQLTNKFELTFQVQVQCCFTSTETILRNVRDGELRTATSTFTQLLSSAGV